jgi:hypothetical protein
LVLISLALTLGFLVMIKDFKLKHYYVSAKYPRTVTMESFFIFWGFLILLSTMVPMAMFILWVLHPTRLCPCLGWGKGRLLEAVVRAGTVTGVAVMHLQS